MFIPTNFEVTIPKLHEQQSTDEKKAFAKYYVPGSDWSWYILEYSKLQNLFYGYIEPENEYTYFTTDDLQKTAYEYDIDITLEIGFEPTMIKDL